MDVLHIRFGERLTSRASNQTIDRSQLSPFSAGEKADFFRFSAAVVAVAVVFGVVTLSGDKLMTPTAYRH